LYAHTAFRSVESGTTPSPTTAPRQRQKALTLLLALGLLCQFACASGAARYGGELPGSRLSEMKRFYVQHHEGDSRDIHLAIQEELQSQGFHVDAGKGEARGEYDAIVTYVDRYLWDWSMYCISLTLYVRDTQTGYITATGWSWRPSTVRKTPQGHARIIFTEIFGEPAR